MMQYPHGKAVEVAHLIIDILNRYKRAVGLPPTTTDATSVRFNGIVSAILNLWEVEDSGVLISPERNHENWRVLMTNGGWKCGEVVDEVLKTHPALVHYNDVPILFKVNDLIFLNVARANKPEKQDI